MAITNGFKKYLSILFMIWITSLNEFSGLETISCDPNKISIQCKQNEQIYIRSETYSITSKDSCTLDLFQLQQGCFSQNTIGPNGIQHCNGRHFCSYGIGVTVNMTLSPSINCGSISIVVVKYECVPVGQIFNICDDVSVSLEEQLYLQSPHYPENHNATIPITCQCQLQAMNSEFTILEVLLETNKETANEILQIHYASNSTYLFEGLIPIKIVNRDVEVLKGIEKLNVTFSPKVPWTSKQIFWFKMKAMNSRVYLFCGSFMENIPDNLDFSLLSTRPTTPLLTSTTSSSSSSSTSTSLLTSTSKSSIISSSSTSSDKPISTSPPPLTSPSETFSSPVPESTTTVTTESSTVPSMPTNSITGDVTSTSEDSQTSFSTPDVTETTKHTSPTIITSTPTSMTVPTTITSTHSPSSTVEVTDPSTTTSTHSSSESSTTSSRSSSTSDLTSSSSTKPFSEAPTPTSSATSPSTTTSSTITTPTTTTTPAPTTTAAPTPAPAITTPPTATTPTTLSTTMQSTAASTTSKPPPPVSTTQPSSTPVMSTPPPVKPSTTKPDKPTTAFSRSSSAMSSNSSPSPSPSDSTTTFAVTTGKGSGRLGSSDSEISSGVVAVIVIIVIGIIICLVVIAVLLIRRRKKAIINKQNKYQKQPENHINNVVQNGKIPHKSDPTELNHITVDTKDINDTDNNNHKPKPTKPVDTEDIDMDNNNKRPEPLELDQVTVDSEEMDNVNNNKKSEHTETDNEINDNVVIEDGEINYDREDSISLNNSDITSVSEKTDEKPESMADSCISHEIDEVPKKKKKKSVKFMVDPSDIHVHEPPLSPSRLTKESPDKQRNVDNSRKTHKTPSGMILHSRNNPNVIFKADSRVKYRNASGLPNSVHKHRTKADPSDKLGPHHSLSNQGQNQKAALKPVYYIPAPIPPTLPKTNNTHLPKKPKNFVL